MSRASLKKIWTRLPAWGALMLGFGMMLTGNAQAEKSQLQPTEATPEALRLTASSLDDVALKMVGETIYVSQGGSAFEELRLGDTPETARLRNLLRDAGAMGQAVSVPVGSMIVASGGGSGNGAKPKSQSSNRAVAPEQGK
jgi:hypothetical protein